MLFNNAKSLVETWFVLNGMLKRDTVNFTIYNMQYSLHISLHFVYADVIILLMNYDPWLTLDSLEYSLHFLPTDVQL